MRDFSNVSPIASPGLTRKKLILVIDDEPAIRETIKEFLVDEGFEVQLAANGVDALNIIKKIEFDLIITDLSMPGMDGFTLIKHTKPIQPLTPVIVLTGQGTAENAINALQIGAYDFVTKPIRDLRDLKFCVERGIEKKSLLTTQQRYQRNLEVMVAEQTQALLDKNRELILKNRMLAEYAREIESVSVSVISSLMAALEEKDSYTAGHSRRVTRLAKKTAEIMGFSDLEIWMVEKAAELHDIGKLIVDVGFINKPGPLSPKEWVVMRRHPVAADRFLAPFTFLETVRPLIRHHHERLDGTGYPDGLSGDELDIFSQIIAAADCYDAMTSSRSYRAPMSRHDAIAELEMESGKHFSKEVLEALLKALSEPKGPGT